MRFSAPSASSSLRLSLLRELHNYPLMNSQLCYLSSRLCFQHAALDVSGLAHIHPSHRGQRPKHSLPHSSIPDLPPLAEVDWRLLIECGPQSQYGHCQGCSRRVRTSDWAGTSVTVIVRRQPSVPRQPSAAGVRLQESVPQPMCPTNSVVQLMVHLFCWQAAEATKGQWRRTVE